MISVKGDYANLRKLCTGKNILSIVYLFDLLVSFIETYFSYKVNTLNK